VREGRRGAGRVAVAPTPWLCSKATGILGLVRSRPRLACFLLGLVILASTVSSGASASSVRALALSEMMGRCEVVLEGRVREVQSRKDPDSGAIHTYVTFEVLDVLYGPSPGPRLTLRFLGGRVGERALRVAGASVPEVGERGIYFVESTRRPLVNPLLGWAQGRILLMPDREGHARAMSAAGAPIVAIDPSPPRRAEWRSTGVAVGLSADPLAPLERALPASDLKRALRRMAPRSIEDGAR